MTESYLLTGLALATLLTAFALGPLLIVSRGTLRTFVDPDIAKLRAPGLGLGLAAGSVASVALIGLSLGGQFAVWCAALTLLCMLAALDLIWRWLPHEWTVPLLILGLGSAGLTGEFADAVLGAAIGGGLLLILRTAYLVFRDVEALGIGDIWLAAGLGAFVGSAMVPWLLCLAACLGLVMNSVAPQATNRRYGVAFGAHLCLATLIILPF